MLIKLFSGLLFKCAQCNVINQTETMELVAKEEESSQKSFLNSTCYDNHHIFSSSLMQNDSCIKSLFGNSFNQSINLEANNDNSLINNNRINALFNTPQGNNNSYSYFTPKNKSTVNSYSNSDQKDYNRIVNDFSNKLHLNSRNQLQDYSGSGNNIGTGFNNKFNPSKNPFVFLNEKTIKHIHESDETINRNILYGAKSKLGKMIELSLRDSPIDFNQNDVTNKANTSKK